MALTFTDVGIVLGREVWREFDKRVVLFTAEHGKVDAVATGAAKTTSKLGAHLEPLKLVEIMIAEGKQFAKVAQARTQETLGQGTSEYLRLCLAGEILSLVRQATVQRVPDAELFSVLLKVLQEINSAADPVLVTGHGLFRLMEILGYAPALENCVHCGIDEGLDHFSPAQGGVVCANCAFGQPEDCLRFSNGGAEFLQAMRAHLVWRGLL